jgi:hypothetical protein
MKQIRRREFLLLILPCAALAGYALFLQLQSEELHANEYSLALDKLEAKPWVNGQTKVSMVLRMKGPWPDRFMRGQTVRPGHIQTEPEWATASTCDLFYKRNGQMHKYVWPKGTAPQGDFPQCDQERKLLVSSHSFKLSDVPSKYKPLECRTRLTVWEIAYDANGRQASRVQLSDAKGSIWLRR